MRVLVLHQAVDISRADEADTLVQAEEIVALLHGLGHAVDCAGVASLQEVESALEQNRPDCVFNLVESFSGSDRFAYLVPGMLEALRIPCTGNTALPMHLASDKQKLGALLLASGIAVPAGPKAGEEVRYIVKSVSEHASFGLDRHSVVTGAKAAHALMAAKAAQHGGEWLAEEYIEGREFNLSLLGKADGFMLLPPAEILFEDFPADVPRIVDYAAKWDESSHAYHHTPRRFTPATDAMDRIASGVWEALGLRGYARIDLRMDRDGKLWVIDVNPNPCLSADAGFMAAAKQAGLTPASVIEAIVKNASDASRRTPSIAA